MSMRDDDGMDALIDRVARDLTAGDPPAGLAEHVQSRIAGHNRAPSFVWWRPAMAVALLVLVIASATALLVRRGPSEDGSPQRASNSPVVADGGLPDEPRNPPAITQSQAGRVPQGGPAEGSRRPDVVSGRPPTVGTAVAGTSLPAIEPLAVSPIDDPVLIAEMSAVAMPIEIEPLQVAPLDVVTASDAGL